LKPSFLPFARPSLDEATIDDVGAVLRSGWIASGPKVLAFERALTEYFQGRATRVFNSATAALEVALQLCGIGPGDQVITPAQGFFATANMIAKVGARPVFVDVALDTRNMDLRQAAGAISPRTRALMPVHFGGLPVDMDALYALAHDAALRVIEDAALAMGASSGKRKIGSFGDLTVFSFHPNKNMTAIEGGALCVNSEEEARTAEKLRFHGIVRLPDGTRDVEFAAGKSNLPDVNAAVGLRQLAQLDRWNQRRRELAQRYFANLHSDPPCLLPARGDEGHAWNMFAILLPLEAMRLSRKAFIEAMRERGIGIGISYEASHLTTLYRQLGYREGVFPNAERIGRETVSLPLFPQMTDSDVDRVCEALAAVLKQAKR
jgi:dTDP-4-amino-4,6-dideoxygalactose transaminase